MGLKKKKLTDLLSEGDDSISLMQYLKATFPEGAHAHHGCLGGKAGFWGLGILGVGVFSTGVRE